MPFGGQAAERRTSFWAAKKGLGVVLFFFFLGGGGFFSWKQKRSKREENKKHCEQKKEKENAAEVVAVQYLEVVVASWYNWCSPPRNDQEHLDRTLQECLITKKETTGWRLLVRCHHRWCSKPQHPNVTPMPRGAPHERVKPRDRLVKVGVRERRRRDVFVFLEVVGSLSGLRDALRLGDEFGMRCWVGF